MVATAGSTGAGIRIDVTLKLTQLQNLCKRDPEGYREDYDAQIRSLESELGILALQPSTEPSPRLIEIIQFAAAVSSSSYKGAESDRVAGMLMGLLVGTSRSSSFNSGEGYLEAGQASESQAMVTNLSALPVAAIHLNREVRKTCVSALILMRNKGVLEPLRLLQLFFRIMAVVPDKALREMLYKHLVNDIRNINKKGKRDEKINRTLQSFLHRVVCTHGAAASATAMSNLGGILDDPEEAATNVAARKATDLVCELYRRQVWTDDRAVAVVASAVESRNSTVMCRAIRFFLGIEEKMIQDAQVQRDEEWNGTNTIDYHSHSKKTASRERHVQRQMKARKKAQRKKESSSAPDDWMDAQHDSGGNKEAASPKKMFPAIELLRDPQGLAEAVFKKLKVTGAYKYEVKLLMINFVTRLVGNHELLVLPLYPFLQKYMGGQQKDVTAILAYTVQAAHEKIPTDELYGILKTIAYNFITERCSEEQIAVGINCCRAICSRVPATLSREESQESSAAVIDIEAFARDLAAFGNHRDRSVAIAGKAWTNFVRETNPGLLQGKHRGSHGAALHRSGVKPLRYGEKKLATGVEGSDLLVEYELRKKAALGRQQREHFNDDDDNGEEVESGSWHNAEDSEQEEEDEDDDDGEDEEQLNDVIEESGTNGRNEVEFPSNDDDESGNVDNVVIGEDEKDLEDDTDSDSAPELLLLTDQDGKQTVEGEDTASVLNVSRMSTEERDKLKQQVSSTRVFSATDFKRMRKLVEREQRAKRDPREAARRKRALAQGGGDFEELSDDDDEYESQSESSEDEGRVRVSGVVKPDELAAEATRKRKSKAERIQKILAGRTEFEAKKRDGGATNVEKRRTKNFVMTKFGKARSKIQERGGVKRKNVKKVLNHEARKRRRKL